MGARLLTGGLSREADVGRGGAVVMLSFTPKSQDTGEPGREMRLADTWAITSCAGSWSALALVTGVFGGTLR